METNFGYSLLTPQCFAHQNLLQAYTKGADNDSDGAEQFGFAKPREAKRVSWSNENPNMKKDTAPTIMKTKILL